MRRILLPVLLLAASLLLAAPRPTRAEDDAGVQVKVRESKKSASQADSDAKVPTAKKKTKKSKKSKSKHVSKAKASTSLTAEGEGQDRDAGAPPEQGKDPAKGHAKTKGKKGKKHKTRTRSTETAESVAPAPCYNLRSGGRTRSGKHGRCEPQSLTYARCRKKIDSCRIGHENGPMTWFHCETKQGNTSSTPGDGTVLILGKNHHGMPTGHIMIVEKAEPKGAGIYRLVLSHTNYDRRCHLETNIETTYDQNAKTLDIHTGAWKGWGRRLPVAGFIVD